MWSKISFFYMRQRFLSACEWNLSLLPRLILANLFIPFFMLLNPIILIILFFLFVIFNVIVVLLFQLLGLTTSLPPLSFHCSPFLILLMLLPFYLLCKYVHLPHHPSLDWPLLACYEKCPSTLRKREGWGSWWSRNTVFLLWLIVYRPSWQRILPRQRPPPRLSHLPKWRTPVS